MPAERKKNSALRQCMYTEVSYLLESKTLRSSRPECWSRMVMLIKTAMDEAAFKLVSLQTELVEAGLLDAVDQDWDSRAA
jgi:hypothetical protein